MKMPHSTQGVWITEFYVYITVENLTNEKFCDRGFPHSPQVSPQDQTGKTPDKPGFIRGEWENHPFY